MKIVWPGAKASERAEMTMRFYDMHATSFDPARAAQLFSRRDLAAQQAFDLARRAPDGPGISQTQAVDMGTPKMR